MTSVQGAAPCSISILQFTASWPLAPEAPAAFSTFQRNKVTPLWRIVFILKTNMYISIKALDNTVNQSSDRTRPSSDICTMK